MHGGLSHPGGPGHPGWKGGRFSKAFGPLHRAVDAALEDEDLLDPHRPVAAALAMLEHVGTRWREGDTPELRAQALAAWEALSEAHAAGAPEASRMLEDLGELLRAGVESDRDFAAVAARSEEYRKAVNDALKIKLQAAASINVGDLTAALDALVSIVVEEGGADVAKRVARRFDQERLGGRLARGGLVLGSRAQAAARGQEGPSQGGSRPGPALEAPQPADEDLE
jgi:hypothetical protein